MSTHPNTGFTAAITAIALLTSSASLGCSGAPPDRQESVSTGGLATAPLTGPVARLMTDLSVLSADSMGGRAVGSSGNEMARAYLVESFEEAGLEPFDGSFELPFTFDADGEQRRGVNVVGFVPGASAERPWIVVTAHYDHLGTRDGEIYNGADDNASGTAALLWMARRLVDDRPVHPVAFAAVDAEELGLQGARALVADPPPELAMNRVALNVNMDMVSRNDSVLYAAGTYHYPFLEAHLNRARERAGVVLRYGHDQPGLPPGDDWTNASDHGPFHAAGIPFVYFGVEDHADYHQPSDDFERVDADFYGRSVSTILEVVRELDASLVEIAAAAGRPDAGM